MNLGILLSLFFCGYIVGLLIGEQYEVFFAYNDRPIDMELMRVLVCFDLDDIKFDRLFYRNESAVSLGRLATEVKKVFGNLSEENFVGFKTMKLHSNKTVIQAIDRNGYFFHNFKFCIILEFQERKLFDSFADQKQLKYAIGETPYKFLYEFVNNLDVRHQLVKNQEPPYSECRKYTNNGARYFRFKCINDCLVARRRSIKYFYPAIDSGSVHLTGSLTAAEEMPCFDACSARECRLEFMMDKIDDVGGVETEELVSYPRLDRLDFYLQLIMLIALFLNVSLLETLPALIKKLPPATRKFLQFVSLKRRYLRIFSTRNVVAMISVLFLLVCYYEKATCYHRKLLRPNKRWILNFTSEFEPISLVICLPINLTVGIQNSDPKKAFANRTLAELERQTDDLFRTSIQQIYLAYHNKKQPVLWSQKSDVYFFYSSTGSLNRCFDIRINDVIEPKYQALLSISMLMIKSSAAELRIFLIPEGEEFAKGSYRWKAQSSYLQKTVRKSGNCIDYKQKFAKTRMQLLDKCELDELHRYRSTIWARGLINKRYLTKRQWEEGILDFKFKNKWLIQAFDQCKGRYSTEACIESSFKDDNFEIRQEKLDESVRAISLYYKKEHVYEEQPSLYELVIELISIQTVGLGINALKLFVGAFATVRFVCQIKLERIAKLFWCYRWLVYLLCLAGFVCQSIYFFDGVLNGDFVYSQHYEDLDRVESAEHIFCFDFDVSAVDSNHELSGSYLNELSKEISLSKYFKRVEFLNSADEWTVVECNESISGRGVQFFDVNLVLFQNLKCYTVELHLAYEKEQFLYKKDISNLKIFFNEKFYQEKRKLYFLSKVRNRMDLSPMIILDHHLAHSTYTIRQELFEITLNDKLNLIKSPLSLFFEPINWKDVSNYVQRLIFNFRTKYR